MNVRRFSTWVEPLDRAANAYLVQVDDLSFLVDGGVQGPPEYALRAPYALVTHWHWDHVLGLARAKYRGLICASHRAIDYLSGATPRFEGSAAVMRAFGEAPQELRPLLELSLARVNEVIGYIKGEGRVAPVEECEPVQTGVVKAVSCPGHSDDHLCYIVGDHAFVGDLVNPDAGLSVLDLEDYIASLLGLLSYGSWSIAHPGHGRDVDRGYVAKWAAESISGKLRRVVKLASMLSVEWRPLASYLDALYPSENPFVRWIGARSLLGYALTLEKMGLAELNTEGQPWTIRAREGADGRPEAGPAGRGQGRKDATPDGDEA